MTKGTIVAGVLAVFLALNGGYAVFALAREASGAGFGSFRATLEQRVAGAIGPDFALYEAVRASTVPESEFLFLGTRDAETSLAYNNMVTLLYPRRFHAVETVPESWDPESARFDGRVHAIAFGPYRDLDLAAVRFELLAEGPRFKLWRFLEEGR